MPKFNVKIGVSNLELNDLHELLKYLVEAGFFDEDLGDTLIIETIEEKENE